MFLTKYIGNYNITKLGNKFMLENKGHAIIMEKLQWVLLLILHATS